MEASKTSAFSHVSIEDGEVVVTNADHRMSVDDAVEFPDVFSSTISVEESLLPEPSTSEEGARNEKNEEAGTESLAESVQQPDTNGGGTKDNDSGAEEEVTSDSHVSIDNAKNIISSLAEGVKAGISKRDEFPIVPSKAALLVVDIQEYLSKPNSIQEEEQNEYFYHTALPRTLSNMQRLLEQMRTQRDAQTQGCEVIFTFLEALTQDCRDVSLDYKLSGPELAKLPNSVTDPAKFLEQLPPRPRDGKGDILIPKTSCSVFMSTNLHFVLQNLHVEQLLICGQLTDQCVESAVRDAADLGYFVTVVDDACAAQTEIAHQKGLAGMKGFSRILTTEKVLRELRNPQQTIQRAVASAPFQPEPAAQVEKSRQVAEASLLKRGFNLVSARDWSSPPWNDVSLASPLLRTLEFVGVQFVRFMAVDAFNSIRCKAIPLDKLLSASSLNYQVAIAQVCFAGLPTFGDMMLEGTGLDAQQVLTILPDIRTLQILPYAPKTAVLFGTAHELNAEKSLSALCTRGLLARVLETAKEHDVAFTVGAEVEFCLFDASGKPVDQSVFANTTTLNQQQEFISDLYTQLQQQHVSVTQIHAESACGQLEVVLEYLQDPLVLVDHLVLTRETIKAVSSAHKLCAVFLPKVHPQQAGNGLHLHLSFRHLASSQSSNAFPHPHLLGELSHEAKSFLEGILQHLPALLALTMPTENSFRRIGPGCWTGHVVGWDIENKESPLRVCCDAGSGALTNVEYKLSDGTANPYLMLASILACGMNGIVQRSLLRPSLQDQSTGEALPTSLEESLACLRRDSFLKEVLGPKLSQAYLAVREAEAARSSRMSLEEELELALQK